MRTVNFVGQNLILATAPKGSTQIIATHTPHLGWLRLSGLPVQAYCIDWNECLGTAEFSDSFNTVVACGTAITSTSTVHQKIPVRTKFVTVSKL